MANQGFQGSLEVASQRGRILYCGVQTILGYNIQPGGYKMGAMKQNKYYTVG